MPSATEVHKLIDDRPEDGVFRVHRDIYKDPAIFEMEMAQIFGRTWLFVGLESQVPNPNDYFTTTLGRTPVVVSRSAQGELHCFVNSCRHKGATVFNMPTGSKPAHVCPYHAWTYDSAGRCTSVNGEATGRYTAAFSSEGHDMQRVARFANYRGLLFASLSDEVPELEEHLGEARTAIDLIVDQSGHGIELIKGQSSFTYDGNWKLQLENGTDAYHFLPTHVSYINVLRQRGASGEQRGTGSVYENLSGHRESLRGSYGFANGHALLWGGNPSEEQRPLYESKADLLSRVGEVRARYMLSVRNLTLFPNVQFAENASLQLRVIRPISVDKTEVTAWCVAPVGESAAARVKRLRQYEDFFNLTGCATPDDIAAYEACQKGMGADLPSWNQGHARGIAGMTQGSNAQAQELGVCAQTSSTGDFQLGDETVYHTQYRAWLKLMTAAAQPGERNEPAVAQGSAAR
ncbi:MAG: aromatic ring-hydroxylating dioxygenase subunit alpha [Burkholderiaceae bacterium]|nr:aromatic ring-hydroxylating dioxygenase subunit alpha [Burkholderiaceae bacterium]